MPRGGYRKPSGAQPASGPGKFSKRTDSQAVRTPGLAGSDLQYGDVGMLQAAQKAAPLPAGVGQMKTAQRRPEGAPLQQGKLPSYLFDTPTALPGTPDTNGLSTGPGGGPDVLDSAVAPLDEREQIMDYIYKTYDNKEAAQWLIDFRNERAASAVPATPPGATPMQAPLPQATDQKIA